jgi:tetratricopeptide (TPR) repeat protein
MIESWLPDLPALASMPAAGTVEPAKVAEAIRHSYVRVLVLKEKFADALKLIDQYLDKSPNDKVLLNLKSTCLSELGRPAESIKVLEKVLGLEPDDAGANNNLGYNLAEQGVQLEKAERMLRKAVDNRPGEPSFMDSLGWILYREGRYHEAASQLREVVFSEEDAAQHPVIFDHAGDAFWRLGWTAEAAKFWEKSVELCGKESVMSGETRQVQAKAAAKLKAYQQKKAPEIAPPAAPETPASAPTSKPASKPASTPATKIAK